MSRIVFHRGPVVRTDYHWVQLGLVWQWKFGTWWAYQGLVHYRAIGPFRIITLRRDSLARKRERTLT